MEDLWFDEAERNHVLPLDDTLQERLAALIFPTYGIPQRGTYLPGGGPVRDETLPPLFAGFTLSADIEVPDGPADGVLAALGDLTGGFVLRVADGRLSFTCSRAGEADRVTADRPLAPGRRTVAVRYRPGDGTPDAPGTFVLLDDGEEIASTPIGGPWPTAFQHGGAGLSIGHDRGLPVDRAYRPPHPWNGVLHSVTVDTGTTPEPDLATELRTALHSD